MTMYRLARDITDRILPPVTLQVGKRYIHPDHGLIQVVDGMYRNPRNGRVSNAWHWIVVATGEHHHGYGENWPQAP